jgi:phosphomannomutase
VVVRPSGTEPKLKAYLEVVTPAEVVARDVAAARRGAAEQLRRIGDDLLPLLG